MTGPVQEMLAHVPTSPPGSASLDSKGPWGYRLRYGTTKGPEEVTVSAVWRAPFALGALLTGAAVAAGVTLPAATHTRALGFVSAGLALAGVVLLALARFRPARPDELDLARAIVQLRSRAGVEDEKVTTQLWSLAQQPRGAALVRAEMLPTGTLTRVSSVAWRAQVQARARKLTDELARAIDAPPSRHWDRASVESNVRLAYAMAASEPRVLSFEWLRRWASGSDIETAWTALHDAEAELLMVISPEALHARIPEIRAALAATLADDGRVPRYAKLLDEIEALEPAKIRDTHREEIRNVKSAIDSTSDTAHSNIRNYRNWLLIVSGAVTAGLVGVAVAHAAHPPFLDIPQRADRGAGADVTELETAGAVGGLLMALFALIRLRVYSGPVALPLWQSLVRIPAGAAAGLVGAILLQGQIVASITLQSRSGLLGYAVLFGAVPELLLRLLDKRVNEATAAARPKSDPLKDVPRQADAGG